MTNGNARAKREGQAPTQLVELMTALASDYWSVYYVELDRDEGVCFQESGEDKDFKIGQWFPFTQSMMDYAEECVLPEYREELLRFVSPAHIRQSLKDQQVISYRYRIMKEGKPIYVQVRIASVHRPDDEDRDQIDAIGLSFSNVDAETRATLEQNRALSDALKAAEEANAAKTAFLSNMSHEIRTPMNAIIGLNDIAMKEPSASDEVKRHLEKIGTAAQHLLEIINQILDMSRIESGQVTVENEELSFAECWERVNAMVESQCQEKGLRYACEKLGRIDDYYVGDAVKLRQVMVNLLGNAVKFTPEGGEVRFTVEETRRFEGRATLRFVIRDTGIGMSAAYLAQAFDTFSQEDTSTTSKYGSTGLGLPITKRLVDLMNGTIEVESEKGIGTTFTVTVTLGVSQRSLAGSDAQGAPEDGDAASVKPSAGVDLNGRRILLAEDMPVNAEIIVMVLGMRGMEVDVAENGRIAAEMFAERPAWYYDAILMDMRMPEMDGLQATRAIRAMDRADAREVPVIALTANAFDEDVQRSLQAGLNAHLSKPVEPDVLFRTLEGFVRP